MARAAVFAPEDKAAATPTALKSGIRPKPLLASECLKDDVAPVEPSGRTARTTAAGAAALLLTVGLAPYALESLGGTVTMSAEAIALAVGFAGIAVAPLPYRARARTLFFVGLIPLAFGVGGIGPVAGLAGVDGASKLVPLGRLLAVIALPAALAFRAHYRAYAGARRLLAGAFVLSLPFAAHAVEVALGDGPLLVRTASCVVVSTFALALFGFAGVRTTGFGSGFAVSVSAALALEIGTHAQVGALGPIATALAFLALASGASLGLYQLLASKLACEARKVDVHQRIAGENTNS